MATADVALWLHNKLGSTDDLWSGVTICSQLSRDKLIGIQRCFHSLQPHVKVKLMLSFLHIPRRNMEEWAADMEEILMLATNDTDQWVSTVADIMKTYPMTGSLNVNLDDNKMFNDVLDDLKKIVRKSTDVRMLPLECQFLNRNALMSVAGQQPQLVKHFALKRKPKSAMLRAELLQKSTDAANNKKSATFSTVPFKGRSFAKKMDDTTPYKGIPNKSPLTSDFRGARMERSFGGTPLSGSAPLSMRNSRKGVGIKLLDIDEQPVGAKEAKRRKKQADTEAMELKREQTAHVVVTTATTEVSYTPDYAAGLIAPMTPATPTKVLPAPVSTAVTLTLSNTHPSYLPSSAPHTPLISPLIATRHPAVINVPVSRSAPLDTPPHSLTTITLQSQAVTVIAPPSSLTQSSAQPMVQQTTMVQPPATRTVMLNTSRPAQQPRELELTKEQMQEAQLMFRNSTVVTRPEKAMILGFMAGCRENPCPDQGDILSIRLSEHKEMLPNGQMDIVDTFFQMNYTTGEWKRTKKYRNIIRHQVPSVANVD